MLNKGINGMYSVTTWSPRFRTGWVNYTPKRFGDWAMCNIVWGAKKGVLVK
jgi:hypothetical protein